MTDEMFEKIKCMLRDVWSTIGADVLEANGGEPLCKISVIEYVLDFYELHGRDKEAIKAFEKLDWYERDRIANQAFINKSYGY